MNNELVSEPGSHLSYNFINTVLASYFMNLFGFKCVGNVKFLTGEATSIFAFKKLDGTTILVIVNVAGFVLVKEMAGNLEVVLVGLPSIFNQPVLEGQALLQFCSQIVHITPFFFSHFIYFVDIESFCQQNSGIRTNHYDRLIDSDFFERFFGGHLNHRESILHPIVPSSNIDPVIVIHGPLKKNDGKVIQLSNIKGKCLVVICIIIPVDDTHVER